MSTSNHGREVFFFFGQCGAAWAHEPSALAAVLLLESV